MTKYKIIHKSDIEIKHLFKYEKDYKCIRILNQLSLNNINTIGDLVKLSLNDIKKLPNVGNKTYKDFIPVYNYAKKLLRV